MLKIYILSERDNRTEDIKAYAKTLKFVLQNTKEKKSIELLFFVIKMANYSYLL